MEPSINYLAVFLGGIASMLVGFIWYSGAVFGKKWARLMGYTDQSLKEAQKEMGMLYGVSFVLAILTTYILAHVVDLSLYFYGNPPIQTGLTSAFFMWLGFIMPVQVTGEIFGAKRWKVFQINTGYQLASLLAAGFIMGLFAQGIG